MDWLQFLTLVLMLLAVLAILAIMIAVIVRVDDVANKAGNCKSEQGVLRKRHTLGGKFGEELGKVDRILMLDFSPKIGQSNWIASEQAVFFVKLIPGHGFIACAFSQRSQPSYMHFPVSPYIFICELLFLFPNKQPDFCAFVKRRNLQHCC